MNTNPLSFESHQVLDSLPTARSVGSVWRRCVAYLVDSLILGAVGGGLGKIIFDKLSQLGLWGPLAGFCFALAYFATLDSEIGDGQTLGKRWLKLRVIDVAGNTISFAKSLLRAAVFLVPSFLFWLKVPESRTPWFVSELIVGTVLWVGGSTLYLITFNRQTRQGLHDLAVETYVANAEDGGPAAAEPISRRQWATLGGLLVVVSVGAGIVEGKMEKLPPIPQMRQDARLIEQINGVDRARVSDLLTHTSAGITKDLLVSIHVKSSVQEAFADKVARTILQNDPNAQNYDRLNILIFHGYDIGIAADWSRQEFARTPAEWHQLMVESSPTPSSPTAHP